MALKKSQRSLRAWTKQKWRTKSGKKSSETGERYLPEKAIKALSAEEYAATSRKKRKDTAKGKQHSKQPKKTARKVRKYRRVGKKEGGPLSSSERLKKLIESVKGLDKYLLSDITEAHKYYEYFKDEMDTKTKEEWAYLDIPTFPINTLEDWAKFRNISAEELERLKKESDLELYSRKQKRNDPDAKFGKNPEISETPLTNTEIERIGREKMLQQAQTFLDFDLRESIKKKGVFSPFGAAEKGKILFPVGDREIEAHEAMHIGFDNVPGIYEHLKNKFGQGDHEHTYVIEKTMPQFFDLDMPPPKGFSKEARINYIKDITEDNDALDKNYRQEVVNEVEKYVLNPEYYSTYNTLFRKK